MSGKPEFSMMYCPCFAAAPVSLGKSTQVLLLLLLLQLLLLLLSSPFGSEQRMGSGTGWLSNWGMGTPQHQSPPASSLPILNRINVAGVWCSSWISCPSP